MVQAQFIARVCQSVLDCRVPDRPLIVGISGADTSGKSRFAANLAKALRGRGHTVHVVSIDDFQHPRSRRYARGPLSPEGYYCDSFDLSGLAETILQPVCNSQDFPVSCSLRQFDLSTDSSITIDTVIERDDLLLIEGVFLFRSPILALLDLKIFLRVAEQTVLARAFQRDSATMGGQEEVGNRYRSRYLPAQRLHFAQDDPEGHADIVIDNNDWQRPQIIREHQ